MPKHAEHPRPPEDFAPVLASNEPLLLVGGQAVNLWALYYAERTAGLAPFVSRDVDVLGDRKTLRQLAVTAGVEPQFFPLRPPTNEVGAVAATDAAGNPLLVEVLRHVHGVTNDELFRPVYTVAVGEGGIRVRIPGPVALLQAKIANAADLPQRGRQDLRHVRILACLMPGYLADLEASVAKGTLEERELLTTLERLLSVVTAKHAPSVLRAADVDRRALFAELTVQQMPKLRAFVEKRLPRALG